MKIAIDAGPLKTGDSVRGIGVYVRELTQSLKNVEIIDVSKANLSKYDVIHFTRFNPFRVSLPAFKPRGTKFILTIYDLIPLIYPEHYPPGIKGKINCEINKFLINKNVDAIVTISETSKKDIIRFLDVNSDNVHAIHLAPRPIFRKIKTAKYKGLPKRFALYVGDLNYNKNIPLLLKACKLASIPLVIAGKQAKEIEGMNLNHAELMHLRNLDLSGVTRLGFVSDEDLVEIYNLASVYIQPSLYEGFGLPVLESFASGCPVVASETQALVEIGEAACLFADPKDPRDFADKVTQVIEDKTLREQLVSTGFIIAKKFSWERTAEETMKIYESL